jgi:competence protein ComEC
LSSGSVIARRMLVAILGLFSVPAGAAAQTLRVYHIDVDQGSATLFVSPSGKTLLVDSGRNGHGPRLRAALQQAGVTRIDYFVATHYHDDHYGGIDELRTPPAIPIGHAYDRGDKAFLPASRTGSPRYQDYQNSVGQQAEALTRGMTIPLDPLLTITAIAAGGAVLGEANPPAPGQEENDMSVSLLIAFGGFRYFIAGDTETPTEAKIAARDLVTDVDVYVADHHGADNGSSQVLLDDMRPAVVVISNGNTTVYDHPRRTMLDRVQGLSPAPAVFQTNKYLHVGEPGDQGGNVPDAFIADLEATDSDGTILITVDPSTGAYVVTYRDQSHSFPIKGGLPGTVVIESLLPDPAGDDGQDEEVVLRNRSPAAVPLAGWLLRDASGKVWALAGAGTLAAGQSVTIRRAGMPMSLNNGGDTIVLLNAAGSEQDHISYGAAQPGVRIQTGH